MPYILLNSRQMIWKGISFLNSTTKKNKGIHNYIGRSQERKNNHNLNNSSASLSRQMKLLHLNQRNKTQQKVVMTTNSAERTIGVKKAQKFMDQVQDRLIQQATQICWFLQRKSSYYNFFRLQFFLLAPNRSYTNQPFTSQLW